MYAKKILLTKGTDSSTLRPFCSDTRICRPISYYVKGGVDLDGVTNRPPLPAQFSSTEDVASGDVDISTDVRVSPLDICAMASEAATESEARALNNLQNKD